MVGVFVNGMDRNVIALKLVNYNVEKWAIKKSDCYRYPSLGWEHTHTQTHTHTHTHTLRWEQSIRLTKWEGTHVEQQPFSKARKKPNVPENTHTHTHLNRQKTVTVAASKWDILLPLKHTHTHTHTNLNVIASNSVGCLKQCFTYMSWKVLSHQSLMHFTVLFKFFIG